MLKPSGSKKEPQENPRPLLAEISGRKGIAMGNLFFTFLPPFVECDCSGITRRPSPWMILRESTETPKRLVNQKEMERMTAHENCAIRQEI